MREQDRPTPSIAARQLRPNRAQWWLILTTAACYAVGYPVALLAHTLFGWLLVSVGGLLLMVLALVTVSRVHRGAKSDPN
ncbi:MAG: hypothetical protein ABI140_19725 [Jatrophihabitantaceae bacterium]